MADSPDPLDRLLDIAVYAPIGLFLEARKQLPRWAKSGRSEIGARVEVARFIGKFAVDKGQQELTKRLSRPPVASGPQIGGEAVVASVEAVEAVASEVAPALTVVMTADLLPIADYDSLAASQVVSRLAALTAVERLAISDYETAHRARRTVLGKIGQLRPD